MTHISSMTHQDFIARLPENQRQFVVELIQELSKIPDVSVYHTDANDGDLRVRVGGGGRVLFTMYWQSRLQAYFCRCLVGVDYLGPLRGLFDVKPTPDYEPLNSSFKFKPNYVNTMSELTSMIREAVKQNQAQEKEIKKR